MGDLGGSPSASGSLEKGTDGLERHPWKASKTLARRGSDLEVEGFLSVGRGRAPCLLAGSGLVFLKILDRGSVTFLKAEVALPGHQQNCGFHQAGKI